MGSFANSISSRLDLVFFIYGLSFSAMGLLLFVQPKKESSFALADSLWLLGWFGVVHGANEFLDMWDIIRHPQGQTFVFIRFSALVFSFAFLLEFGRRAVKALECEDPAWRTRASWLLGRQLLPALLALLLLLAAVSGDFLGTAPALSRLLLGFPGALLAGMAFFGYSKCKGNTLTRLNARNYFILAGAGFIVYSVLGGLVPPKGIFFPSNILNTEVFQAAVGLPVQLFRAICAAGIFGAIMGAMRIFREGALQAAQQELLDIIEFFPDATFVTDKDKKVIAWNRALEKMTGVPKAEMLGQGNFAYSVPFYGERRPLLIDLIGSADPGVEKLYEYVSKRADGAIYGEVFVPSLYNGKGAHVWVTASPLQDKEGHVYGAIESVRDVTDRKLAEEALQRSEAQYRALIETTNTGFLIIDKQGKVVDANQEYIRLTGHRTLAEIRGRSVMDWTAAYEKEKNALTIKKCSLDGYIRNFEIDYTDKNGSITPVEMNATVVDIGGERRILTLCRDITDRRRSEKLLRESADKYRTLTEKSLIGVYLVQDGLFRYVNPKLAEIFGYTEAELTDKKGPVDLVLPEDWPVVNENLRKRLDSEILDVNYAFRGIRKDGSQITVEVFGSKSEYRGRPAVLGTLIEITERKKTQDALRESEERYRTLVDHTEVGIVVHKMGVIRFLNRKMAEAGRVPDPAALIGRNLLDFIHPDYREAAARRIKTTMELGRSTPPEEEVLVALDGALVDVEVVSVPITYGGESCTMSMAYDITERKRAQKGLRESEERYRTLVNNAQVGIVVHQAGVMRFVNRKMAELVRAADPDKIVGRNVLEFMQPDFREFVKERIRQSLASGTPLPPAEEKLLAADGTALDVEINTVPITYQGEPCAMAIVQDITARKNAERELRKVNAELERRVKERTVQLESANNELEAFSYSAAHDMKAPLRRVNIFSEMLEKEAGPALTGEPRGYITNIRRSVTQMTNLVEGLLTLSTTGKRPIELAPVQLSALLKEVTAEIKTETAGRSIEWTEAELPEVNCDRAMLKQVFLNLLRNAAKYSRGASPARIEVLYSLEDGEHVFGVRDNGVGFSMEYSGRLFGVFQRLHRSEDFEGTGIGLSTVKRIVTRHGGRVWAESAPGKGAVFYFTLPAAQ